MNNEKVGYRIGMIISLIIAVVFAVIGISSGGDALIGGLIVAYCALAFGSQIGHDTVVDDIFFGAWAKTINMPGVIFELDLDGILFFIAYKLIIAPIITLVLMFVVGILGTLLAVLVAMFTFPFNVYRVVKETF